MLSEHLHKAKNVKDDEFYTQMKDVERELNHYDFTDKIIYCPCDNSESNFVKYLNGKCKKLLYTSDDFMKHDDLWKQADIIITNPPFSLVRKFFDRCMEFGKKFLFVVPTHAMPYSNILPYLVTSKCTTGYYEIGYFQRPDGSLKHESARFLTNLKVNKPIKEIEPVFYSDNHYDYYDNYPEILNVNRIKDIPIDYFGEMGVPVTILLNFDTREFEYIKKLNDAKINNKMKFKRIVIKRKEQINE